MVVALAIAACTAAPAAEIDLPPQAEADLSAELVEQLEGAVTHAMAATGSPGAIVGVWAPWSGTWIAGLGTQQPAAAGGAV
ncbi:MAG TPA: serine hydrolase, partial [Microbacterium sp.]|nr:serine hydrolase [Microbacterium sp.]